MKTILVTGGAGYIGSHTVHELVNQGYNIIVFDSLEKGHKNFLPDGVKFFQGDVGNIEDLNKVFSSNKIDAVIHFAGYIEAGESMVNPLKYFHNNSAKGITLIKAMNDNGVKNIMFSSTAAVYGNPKRVPITEDHETNPVNHYGASKLMLEKTLETSKVQGISSIFLRYFNAAGAGYGIGEKHNPETHLIPIILEVASGKRDHIKLFGTDYPTPDGTCVRDYIHVLDLASAHVQALKQLEKGKSGIYNVGTGKGYSVKEIINICRNVTGKNIKVVDEKRREGDPPVLVASSLKAQKELNWQPKYDINDIIKSAWEWHKKENIIN
ncbi:UDP-glucose 4-epimerase GalE [Candidatus Woesearchaeota archaeon]|nr:UDP-glucose 4-epimerase GalE [Candidatus Woesearchaeota archaeon]